MENIPDSEINKASIPAEPKQEDPELAELRAKWGKLKPGEFARMIKKLKGNED